MDVEPPVSVYDDFNNTDNGNLHHMIFCYRTRAIPYPLMVSREGKEYAWIGMKQVQSLGPSKVVKDMLSDHFRSQ
jgi:hypothetical protein